MREWSKGMRVRELDKARDVLFFTAAWCAPCKVIKGALARRLKAAAEAAIRLEAAGSDGVVAARDLKRAAEREVLGRVLVVDVDAFPRVANAFGVQSMPTFIRLDDGAELVGPTLDELLVFLAPKPETETP